MNNNEIIIRISTDAKGSVATIEDISKRSKKSFKELEKASTSSGKAQAKAAKTVEDAQKQLGLTTRNEKARMIRAYRTLKKSGVASAHELRLAQKRLNATLKKTPSRLKRITQAIFGLKGAVTGLLALGVGLLGLKFLGNLGRLEQGWIGVAKTTGLAGAELKKFKKTIREMSVEMSGIPIEELQLIAEKAGQLGIKGSKDLAEFTRVVAMVAVATNLTAEEAGRDFAQLSNILKEPIENVERMASVVNELSNNSNATARDITNLAKRIGGAGKNIGLTSGEIFALSATLRDMGVEIEVGGTAISKLLIKMITDTKDFAEVSGVSMEEFAAAVRDKPIKAVELLFNSLSRMNKFEAAAAIDKIGLAADRSTGVMLKMASGVGKLNGHLKRSEREWKDNTSILKEYLTAADGMISQSRSFSNAIQVAAELMGERLLPALKVFLRILTKTVGYMTEYGTTLVKVAATTGAVWAVYNVTAFTGAISKVVKIMGKLLKIELIMAAVKSGLKGGLAGFVKLAAVAGVAYLAADRLVDKLTGANEAAKKLGDEGSTAVDGLVDTTKAVGGAVDGLATNYIKSTTAHGLMVDAKTTKEKTAAIAQGARITTLKDKQIDAYRDTKTALEQSLSDAKAAQARYAAEVIAWEEKIKQAKMTTAERIRGLQQSLMAPEEAYNDRRRQAEENISKAREALANKDFAMAETFATKAQDIYSSMGEAVVENGKTVVDKTTAVDKAMKGLKTTGDLITQVYDEQRIAAERNSNTLLSSIESADSALEDLKEKLKALQDEATTHEIEIDDDDARYAIEQLKLDTESTHTVHVKTVQTKQAGGPVVKARTGTYLSGYGGGDKIKALLEAGEYVNRKEAVRHFGPEFFNAINSLDAAGALRSLGGGAASNKSAAAGGASGAPSRDLGTLRLDVGGRSFEVSADEATVEALNNEIGNIRSNRGDYSQPWSRG